VKGKDFKRDFAIATGVLSKINLTHSSFSELCEDAGNATDRVRGE
jgi:hypothetical protein